jgi:hypothetical protein
MLKLSQIVLVLVVTISFLELMSPGMFALRVYPFSNGYVQLLD